MNHGADERCDHMQQVVAHGTKRVLSGKLRPSAILRKGKMLIGIGNATDEDGVDEVRYGSDDVRHVWLVVN